MSGKKKGRIFWRFVQKLHNPPNWVAWITIATTIIVCPLVVLTIVFDYWKKMYAVMAGFLCAILIIYTVGVVVNSIFKIRRKVIKVADRYEFTRNLHKNYEFRTIFFAVCSFLCNVGYTVFLMAMAFRYRSVWYGAIGIYYILLSVARGGVIIQNRMDEKKYRFDYNRLQTAKVGTYRYCGIMMLILSLSLTISVVELIVDRSGFRHAVWLIYVFAAVAVYKMASAIIHFVHSTKRDDLVVRSVRYINFAVTLMSVLCLQTSILAAFPPSPLAVGIANGVTGALVSLITLALGLYMVVFSVKEKRRLLVKEAELAELVDLESPRGYNRAEYVDEYTQKDYEE